MFKGHFLKVLFKLLRNKYILSILIFLIWLVFFDRNNLIERYKELQKLHQLNKDKSYFNERIEDNKEKINELKTDASNLEKFAREQFLMKKPNEDIFVIEIDPKE